MMGKKPKNEEYVAGNMGSNILGIPSKDPRKANSVMLSASFSCRENVQILRMYVIIVYHSFTQHVMSSTTQLAWNGAENG